MEVEMNKRDETVKVPLARRLNWLNKKWMVLHRVVLPIGMSALIGCTGTIPMPESSTSVVIMAPQTFTRDGVKISRYPQSSSWQMSGPYHAEVVPDSETIGLFPQSTISDVRDWTRIGVYGRWEYDTRFRTYLLGPFEGGNCYLAYVEPRKLSAVKLYNGKRFDYELVPKADVVECGREPKDYGSRDFVLR